ncbi:hypothetical protein C3L33_23095, partial [Rhododendron williamsianum]
MLSEVRDAERRLKDACLSGSVAELEALIKEDELILDQVSYLIGFFMNDSTPLHVAALRGHLDFTKALLTRKPKLATELDSRRSSPLHLACTKGHFEITIEYLLGIQSVKYHANVKNHNGLTALDFVEHCPYKDLKTMEIREFLLQAGVQRSACDGSNPKPEPLPDNTPPPPSDWRRKAEEVLQSIYLFWIKYFKVNHTWLQEVRGHLITAATLTATMAYQAILSPPGGFRQESSNWPHYAGIAILDDRSDPYNGTSPWLRICGLWARVDTAY